MGGRARRVCILLGRTARKQQRGGRARCVWPQSVVAYILHEAVRDSSTKLPCASSPRPLPLAPPPPPAQLPYSLFPSCSCLTCLCAAALGRPSEAGLIVTALSKRDRGPACAVAALRPSTLPRYNSRSRAAADAMSCPILAGLMGLLARYSRLSPQESGHAISRRAPCVRVMTSGQTHGYVSAL
jgi:hypothetical protein